MIYLLHSEPWHIYSFRNKETRSNWLLCTLHKPFDNAWPDNKTKLAKDHKYTCFARSVLCTGNLYDLYAHETLKRSAMGPRDLAKNKMICAGCLEVLSQVASRSVRVTLRSHRGLPRGLICRSTQGPRQALTGSRYPTCPELLFKYPTCLVLKIENYWVLGTKYFILAAIIQCIWCWMQDTGNHNFVIY